MNVNVEKNGLITHNQVSKCDEKLSTQAPLREVSLKFDNH